MQIIHSFTSWKNTQTGSLTEKSDLIKTWDGHVEYQLLGESGPVVVGFHGAPGGYDQIAPLFSFLVSEGFRILSWSRPGYLRTPIRGGISFEDQAELLSSLLNALEISTVGLAAFGHGGPVALHFASRFSAMVTSIVLQSCVTKPLISTPLGASKGLFEKLFRNDPTTWLTSLAKQKIKPLIQADITAFMKSKSGLSFSEAHTLTQSILRDPVRLERFSDFQKSYCPPSAREEGYANDHAMVSESFTLPFAKIKAPVLVIHGTHDTIVSPDHAANAVNQLPKATLFLKELGQHLLFLEEDHAETSHKITAFFKKHHFKKAP